MPRVSIILPAYNAEPTLERTVRSLTSQSLTDIEIILIDDGSTDNTFALAQQLAAGDPRMRVLNQPNGGVGGARSTGLDAATGTYIVFVDADDALDDCLAELVARMDESGADILFFGETIESKRIKAHPLRVPEGAYSGEELKPFIDARRIPWVVWGKVFRRAHIDALRFVPGMLSGDDALFCLHAISTATRFYVLPAPYYRHVRNTGSIFRRYHPRRISNVTEACAYLNRHFTDTAKAATDVGSMVGYLYLALIAEACQNEFYVGCPHKAAARRWAIRALLSEPAVQAGIWRARRLIWHPGAKCRLLLFAARNRLVRFLLARARPAAKRMHQISA